MKRFIKIVLAGFVGLFVILTIIGLIGVALDSPEDTTEREVEKPAPVKTELEIETERYATLIAEHGRDRAGEKIKEEQDAAFNAKDMDRVTLLINASAAAMQQDVDRSKALQEQREAETQEKVNAQFSAWDGSHRKLAAAVERVLNDPSSFEHLETKTMKGTNWPKTFIVRMEYTAKNAFGGRIRHYVLAEISVEDGQIVQVLDEG